MREAGIFEQFDFYRDSTVELLESITSESQADINPTGFSNTLRWNLGHILVAQEGIMYYFGRDEKGFLPTSFQGLFSTGTSPKDWKTTPPTLPEIREPLIEQNERMRATFSGKLEETSANVFAFREKKLTTIGSE